MGDVAWREVSLTAQRVKLQSAVEAWDAGYCSDVHGQGGSRAATKRLDPVLQVHAGSMCCCESL